MPVPTDPAETPLLIILNCFFLKQAAWVFFSSLQRRDAAHNFDELPISISCTNQKEHKKIVIMLYETPMVIKACKSTN